MPANAPKLKLYNTLTRKKEAFEPLDPANVRMYVCGPTVYDFAHIGNARPVIVFDVLYRLLRHLYGEDHVTYVRNITDVDDKINARAVRDFPNLPLNEAIARVTETTASQFHKDVAALGCLQPTHEPRATDHIGGMIEMIETLIAKGHAYAAGGEVLFRVSSMAEYGQLSGRNLEDNMAGARVAVESHKENPADFVLWKQSSANEPGWDSPWGRGRPGWHIECSAMSKAFLGETFDIHGGGLDLIFPHHENEIAQSCCANDTPHMARYWMHNGYLQVEGKKMSKSEGNFVTIHDLLETEKFGGRKWPGSVLRLAMLMTHYRQPIDFSIERLQEARQLLLKFQRDFLDTPERWGNAHAVSDEAFRINYDFLAALADDLNVNGALSALHALQKEIALDGLDAGELRIEFSNSLALLGFDELADFTHGAADAPMELGDEFVVIRIEHRLDALATKDFAKADTIRAELLEQGIQLMDYKDPETGERRTKWEVKR